MCYALLHIPTGSYVYSYAPSATRTMWYALDGDVPKNLKLDRTKKNNNYGHLFLNTVYSIETNNIPAIVLWFNAYGFPMVREELEIVEVPMS